MAGRDGSASSPAAGGRRSERRWRRRSEMSETKQKQKTDVGPWGPVQQPLTQSLPELRQGFEQFRSNPLIPQAQQYTSDVLSGAFLDPATNPHLGALTKAISDPIMANTSAMFSRAGRGTSASASGLAGAVSQGMASGLAAPLFNQYNVERGLQQQAATMAPSMAALDVAPIEWYTGQLARLGSLGQQGTTTTKSSPGLGQTLGGLGMMALGGLTTGIDPTSIIGRGLSGAAPAMLPWQTTVIPA